MLTKCKFNTTTGEILYSVSADEKLFVFTNEIGFDWLVGNFDGRNHHAVYDTDEWTAVERPSLELPSTHSLTTADTWSLPDVPDGTTVVIDGEEAGVVSDGNGLILGPFPLAGTWQIELHTPFPWRHARCEVIVA